MHFYRFHVSDYVSHTRHLSRMEDLAYRRMLDHAYMHERGLAGDAEAVARIIDLRDLVAEVDAVLREFWTRGEDGVWRNRRVEKELALMADKQAKAVAAGKASANARSTDAQRTFNGRSTGGQHESNGRSTIQDSKTPRLQDASTQDSKTPVPETKHAARALVVSADKPDDVPEDLWQEWTAFRKSKRGPVTKRVLDDTRKKATDAGMTMAEALTHWMAQGYAGFFPPKDGKGGKPQDGGFDRFNRWQGVPRGKVDYSVGLGEDDPEHPKQLLANENGIRASKGLPPLTMDELRAMGDPRLR